MLEEEVSDRKTSTIDVCYHTKEFAADTVCLESGVNVIFND
jgi:hypothetical protein